jgi:hypothetical protein
MTESPMLEAAATARQPDADGSPRISGVECQTARLPAGRANPRMEDARSVDPQVIMRTKIVALEEAIKRLSPEIPAEFKTTHYFAPGVYMRELFIPKGACLTGKIHKTEHLNILSQGKLSVMTEDGVKTLTASTVIKSQPGIKRAGYAHEDSVWITVHPNVTDEKDVQVIENMLVVDTFDQFLAFMDERKAITEEK